MIQIRFRSFCQREFERDVFRPGVISLARLIWGALGGGLLLSAVTVISRACDVGVLFPPLAASCFISAACSYLRVARPKSVIVGHFVSSIGGVLAVVVSEALFSAPAILVPVKLGLAVSLAAALMHVFDADHPPAAATAAIPAVLPLPVSYCLLPVHMAWGAMIVVIFGVLWNKVWFEFPAPEGETSKRWRGFFMDPADAMGTAVCILGFVLMALKPWHPWPYHAGLWIMVSGVLVLMFHHFWDCEILTDASKEVR
jgi:hypothetical protein